MDSTGTHLGFAGPALAAQEYRLLALQRLHSGGDNVRLRGQHGPLEVQGDHGVRGRDVQRLERLPGAIGHQGAVAIQVFLEGLTVHRKNLRVIGLGTTSVVGNLFRNYAFDKASRETPRRVGS